MVTSRLRLGFTEDLPALGRSPGCGIELTGNGSSARGPGVVRRLAGVDTAPEPEGVIEERLQQLAEHEVGYQRVVVGAVGHDFALCQIVFRGTGQQLGQIVTVLSPDIRGEPEYSLFQAPAPPVPARCRRRHAVSSRDTAEWPTQADDRRRRSLSTPSRSLSRGSSGRSTCWLRSEKIPVTSPAVLDSSAETSRLAIVE